MYTLFRVCLHLSKPLQFPYTKIALISSNYFSTGQFDVTEETRMNAPTTSTPHLENSNESFNFVTEIFHATLGFLHFGYMSSIRLYSDTCKHVEELEGHLRKMEDDKASWGVNAYRYEGMMGKYKVKEFSSY